MNGPQPKILIIDGISGVPLGRELRDAFEENACTASYIDCLKAAPRMLYGLRSAHAKLINKHAQRDGFFCLPRLSEKDLETQILRERPTLILVIGFLYKFYAPGFLRRTADKINAKLFLYDTDSCNLYAKRREFIFFAQEELPVYDRIFSFSQVTTRLFKDTLKLDAVYMPFGAQPVPIGNSAPSIDALFVGTCDLRRIFLLESIREHVQIHGNRWQRNFPLISTELRSRISDQPVWGGQLQNLLANAKIVLNITRSDFYGAETGVNLRIFEALSAGAFLMTDRCQEIEELLKPGIEIETFSSAGEMSEKLDYYLKHDSKRQEIARQGHAAFLNKHTWKLRVAKMLSMMHSPQCPAESLESQTS
jgi:spore maturation protein CgeB